MSSNRVAKRLPSMTGTYWLDRALIRSERFA